MTFTPLFLSQMPIPLHAIAALLALWLGAVQLRMPKGTTLHRKMGYIWVGLMAFVAISGFFIHEIQMIGPYSLIHLLSVLVLVSLWRAIRYAKQKRIKAHRQVILLLFWLSLVLTGAFTLWPGRVMYQVVTGG